MRIIPTLFFCLFISVLGLHSQDVSKGYILPTTIFLFDSPVEPNRYDLTVGDVRHAEEILLMNPLFIENKPYLKKYKKYYRQFAGYYNDVGQKCVLINFMVDKVLWKEYANHRWLIVLDGGNSHWQAEINLDTKEVISLSINGAA